MSTRSFLISARCVSRTQRRAESRPGLARHLDVAHPLQEETKPPGLPHAVPPRIPPSLHHVAKIATAVSLQGGIAYVTQIPGAVTILPVLPTHPPRTVYLPPGSCMLAPHQLPSALLPLRAPPSFILQTEGEIWHKAVFRPYFTQLAISLQLTYMEASTARRRGTFRRAWEKMTCCVAIAEGKEKENIYSKSGLQDGFGS